MLNKPTSPKKYDNSDQEQQVIKKMASKRKKPLQRRNKIFMRCLTKKNHPIGGYVLGERTIDEHRFPKLHVSAAPQNFRRIRENPAYVK